ncbi:uncharacterized protein IL334_001580 [Kwoniella shivajii]|uniref:RRM domain-containing protein n=1 Tax=Kwoniella shivajii TaxID=564305 RepID=A0ABZ1CSC5_9TREE|nr:hypothetical protein IL334_001580 [Kwoniella shivajii]
MSHIPPPPPFLPAPPTFNAFNDSQSQGYSQGGYNTSQNGGGSVDNGPPPSRDTFSDRRGKRGRGGRQRGGGEGRGGGGRDRGGDRDRERDRSPDRGRRRQENRSIEERVGAERICRTLFVRNVSYEADSAALQASFSTYGEIKTWYDRINERGIIFVTFFDLRSAQKARDGMHGLKAGDRSIDVHYSLPRDKDLIGDCDREKNQGSILIFVHPPRVISEYELGRMCEQFGDVKAIKPGREPAEKIVEYYDSRGSALFFDRMSNQPFQGGTLELKFIWDEKEEVLPPPPPPPVVERPFDRRSGEGPGYGEVRSGRQHPPGPPGGIGRDPRARSPIRGGRRESYPPGPGPGPGRYGELPPPVPQGEDRLEQARKVQQLLANLGGPSNPPPPTHGGPPPRSVPPPHMIPPPPNNQYTPRDTGYTPGPPPPPPLNGGGRNYQQQQQPPPLNPIFPPYPPSSNQAYNPTSSAPPSNPYSQPPAPSPYNPNPTPIPPSQNSYNPPHPPPHHNNQYNPPPTHTYNAPPPPQTLNQNYPPSIPMPQNQSQNSYNPSTPAQQSYSPYPPPPSHIGVASGSSSGPGAYPPPPGQGQNQGYGQNQNSYGYPPPPPRQQQQQEPRSNRQNGQAKDVGSLLAMLSNR